MLNGLLGWFFGNKRTQTLSEISTTGDEVITMSSALQVSTAYACIRLLSETLATLPIDVMKDNLKSTDDLHILKIIKDRPNSYMDVVDFGSSFGFRCAHTEMAMLKLSEVVEKLYH